MYFVKFVFRTASNTEGSEIISDTGSLLDLLYARFQSTHHLVHLSVTATTDGTNLTYYPL